MKKIYFLIAFVLISVFFVSHLALGESENTANFVAKLGKDFGFKNSEDLRIGGPTPNNFINVDDQIIINTDDYFLEYKKANEEESRKFIYLSKGSKFKFKDGNLINANFEVKNDASFCDGKSCTPGSAEYKLGDYIYRIQAGSKVEYEKGENNKLDVVKITSPKNKEVYPPKKIDGIRTPKETEISYDLPKDTNEGDSLIIKNDNEEYKIVKRNDFDFGLNYDTKIERFFIKGAQQIDNLEIGAMQSSDVYLFLGDEIDKGFDKPALKLGEGNNPNLKLFTPAGNKGFTVKILPGEKKYGGIDIKENQNLVLWAVGAGEDYGTKNKINSNSEIEFKSENGKTLVNTKGAFRIFNGNKLIRYNEHTDGVRLRVLDEVLSSTSSKEKDVEFDFTKSDAVSMKIHVKDEKGNDIQYRNLINGKKEDTDIFVITDEKDKQGHITTGKSEEDIGNKMKISNLADDLKKVFDGLSSNEQTRLLGSNNMRDELSKIKKENEEKLKEIAEEKKKKTETKSPVKTTIKTNSNVPKELKDVKVPSNLVQDLDDYSKGWFSSKYVSKLSNKGNSNGIVAIIFGSGNCPVCANLERNIVTNNPAGIVYKIDHSNNQVKNKFGKSGINPNLVKLYPTTVFIDTRNQKIIGWEERNSNINFERYLKK